MLSVEENAGLTSSKRLQEDDNKIELNVIDEDDDDVKGWIKKYENNQALNFTSLTIVV